MGRRSELQKGREKLVDNLLKYSIAANLRVYNWDSWELVCVELGHVVLASAAPQPPPPTPVLASPWHSLN